MKYPSLFLFVALACVQLCAQGPGRVSTASPNLWLKADQGTNCTTYDCRVNHWTDQSTQSRDASQVDALNQPRYRSNRANYQPSIFIVSDSNPNFEFMDLPDATIPSGGSSYSVFCVTSHVSSQGFVCAAGSPTNLQANRFRISTDGALKNSWQDASGDLTTAAPTQNAFSTKLASFNYNGVSGLRTISSDGLELANSTTTGINTASDSNHIGTREDYRGAFVGDIHELLIYPGSLNSTEQNKIESYLAMKYGITLSAQGGGSQGDYLASDGTTVWEAQVGLAQHQNNIISLARDDSSALYQKQAVSPDDTTTMYLDTLAAENSSNPRSIDFDLSFLLLGDDSKPVKTTDISNAEMPGTISGKTIYARLEREWKYSRYNYFQDASLEIKLHSDASFFGVSANDLCLLVDDDGDFSNGFTTAYYNGDGTGLVISYSAGVVRLENFGIAHTGDYPTGYITIASSSLSTPLSLKVNDMVASCKGGETRLSWTVPKGNELVVLEGSVDGLTFEDLEQWTRPLERYHYTLQSTAMQYYRLKVQEPNGETKYSAIQQQDCREATEIILAPNPVRGTLTLELEEAASVEIRDISTRLLYQRTLEAGRQELTTKEFPPGIYLLYIRGQSSWTKQYKFIKN